ncbi:MAG: hypothetical protein U0798_18510 [Gemmataceae bacterium]
MMITRWKLTAGLLGVSLCGLAAMANSTTSRTRSALGCYKADDLPRDISSPPTPMILKTQADSIRLAAAPPIDHPPISPPVIAVAPITPSLPAASIAVPGITEPPAIPVASGNLAPVPVVSPAPIEVPLPKVENLQVVPPVSGTPPVMVPELKTPANTVPVQSKEPAPAPVIPQLEVPKITPDAAPSKSSAQNPVLIPLPGAKETVVPTPNVIPPVTITPNPAPTLTPTPVPGVVPSVKTEGPLNLPGLEFKAPEVAAQTPAKPDIQPIIPDLTKPQDLKPVPSTPPAVSAAVASQDDGVKVVVKMTSGRPSLAIILEGAEMMTLTCEQLDLAARVPGEESGSEIKASGKVTFTAPGCQGQCDELVLNPKTWEGMLVKGVRVKCQQSQRESELSADKMTFKLRSPKDSMVPTISASHSEPGKKK